MARFTKFEEIQAWQKARAMTKELYALTVEGSLARDFFLRDQLRRAAISVMSNIVEGFARRTPKEFARFLNIAHGSAAELQSHLYLAVDLGYLSKTRFEKLYAQADEISKMIHGLHDYLRSSHNPERSTHNSQLEEVLSL